MDADVEYPQRPYPVLRYDKRCMDVTRTSVVDPRTGEVLAWMDERNTTEPNNFRPNKKIKKESNNGTSSSLTDEFQRPLDKYSIFVSRLEEGTTRDEIFQHFGCMGTIVRVTKLTSKWTGKFNGHAYVQYQDHRAATEALYLHGSFLRGSEITVKRKLECDRDQNHNKSISKEAVKYELKSVDSEAVPSDNELSSLSVVVSNIEPGTTQLELASHFQLVGDIKKVIMSEDTREEAAHACITFKDAASAENALTLDGTPLGLSRIVVKRKCDGLVGEQSFEAFEEDSVYIGNIEVWTSEADLESHFQSAGEISRLTILKNKATSHRTSAFIQFKNPESVKKALELNGSSLRGKNLFIKRKRNY